MEQKIKFPRSEKVYMPGKLFPRNTGSYAQSRTSAKHNFRW